MKKTKLTMNELRSLIKEEAQKLQRRTFLENEKKRLQEELGMMEDNKTKHRFAAFNVAENVIKDMDLPDEFLSNENLYLEFVKALKSKLYEKGADLFAKNAGAAPDERY